MWRIAVFSLLVLAGCAARSGEPVRVALLAPFEGAERRIGYEALYTARLAIADADNIWLELVPIDSSGHTSDRAAALAGDAQVLAVISLMPETDQADFEDLPVVWIAAPPDARAPDGVIAISETYPAPDDLIERILNANAFAEPPGTLAAPVYDTTVRVVQALTQNATRASVLAALSAPDP